MNELIASILKTQIEDTNLCFVDKIAGLVKPVTMTILRDQAKIDKVFPVACNITEADCIAGKYKDLIPTSNYKSVIYFEDKGTSFGKQIGSSLECVSYLKLVCWLNLRALGSTECSISALAMANIINAMPKTYFNSDPIIKAMITYESEQTKDKSIFSQYSYEEKDTQYLMYPYDYFAINIRVSYMLNLNCNIELLCGIPIC